MSGAVLSEETRAAQAAELEEVAAAKRRVAVVLTVVMLVVYFTFILLIGVVVVLQRVPRPPWRRTADVTDGKLRGRLSLGYVSSRARHRPVIAIGTGQCAAVGGTGWHRGSTSPPR